MQKKQIDLHIHSIYSDGLLTPAQIVNQAKENDVQVIALTDHNTIDGIAEFLAEAKQQKISVVYGIEFTCQMNGRGLHILGYNFDLKNQYILEVIANYKKLQDLHNSQRLMNFEERYDKTVDQNLISKNGTLTPIRLAYHLKEIGQISAEDFPTKIRGIYELFENPNKSIKKEYLPHLPLAVDAVQIIREADGFPVLAHPQSMDVTFPELLRLYARGLKGIEVFYPGQNPQLYLQWAKKLNLAITAGTDYHGVLDRNEQIIGYTLPEIDEDIYIYTGDIGL